MSTMAIPSGKVGEVLLSATSTAVKPGAAADTVRSWYVVDGTCGAWRLLRALHLLWSLCLGCSRSQDPGEQK